MTRKRRSIKRARSEETSDDDQEYVCLERGNKRYGCRACSYKSERRFNVVRHERRIHEKMITRKCCGKKIKTKGEWYQHCLAFHPGSRTMSITCKTKYKITGNSSLKNLENIQNALYTSQISISPQKRRCSARLRQQAMKRLPTLSQNMDESTDEEDANIPQDLSEKSAKDVQRQSSVIQGAESEDQNLHDSDRSSSSTTTDLDPCDQTFDESEQESEGEEISCSECQFGLSEHLGLDAFIEEIPLNNLEPTQHFLQTLENSEDLSGDLLFEEGVPCGDAEIDLQPGELRDEQVALVLQELTQANLVYNNNNYVSSDSPLLWTGQQTDPNGNEILGENSENPLPPKKKMLKKFLDKENAAPVVYSDLVKEELNIDGRIWNEITEMQRDFLSSIDFDRYKL